MHDNGGWRVKRCGSFVFSPSPDSCRSGIEGSVIVLRRSPVLVVLLESARQWLHPSSTTIDWTFVASPVEGVESSFDVDVALRH